MEFWVISIGIAGPGLDGWAAARPILAGETEYRPAPLTPPIPKLLSAAERRRCSQSARLAIAAAQDALLAGPLQGEAIATVFTSSDGDGPSHKRYANHWRVPHVRYPPRRFITPSTTPRPAIGALQPARNSHRRVSAPTMCRSPPDSSKRPPIPPSSAAR